MALLMHPPSCLVQRAAPQPAPSHLRPLASSPPYPFPPCAPRSCLAPCSFSHDSRYLGIAGEQTVLDVENVETGESLGRLQLRYS